MILALDVPRDRLRRLAPDLLNKETGSELTAAGLELKIPHGGADRMDKAVMVLQALIGEQPKSILDW